MNGPHDHILWICELKIDTDMEDEKLLETNSRKTDCELTILLRKKGQKNAVSINFIILWEFTLITFIGFGRLILSLFLHCIPFQSVLSRD
jgi:hypothetical protein